MQGGINIATTTLEPMRVNIVLHEIHIFHEIHEIHIFYEIHEIHIVTVHYTVTFVILLSPLSSYDSVL